jgi:CRISPR system Cascade subunit CasE
MSTSSLNLIHMQPDPQQLAAWAARHRLLESSGDLGYALHGLMRAVFGERVPRAYRYLDAEQGLLAYTDLSVDELHRAVALAPGDAAAALGLGATQVHSGLSIRPFPSNWPAGHMLGFECRVRPVIREGKTGRERDAFLAAAEESGTTLLERNQVYGKWLAEQFARQRGAELLDVRLDSFRLLDVMRKTQKKVGGDEVRKTQRVTGPEAILTGHLRVADTESFAALLARGVGRHRAFGFGLLLLRPAQR